MRARRFSLFACRAVDARWLDGKALKVRRQDTDLALDLEGGSSAAIKLAEATSSVMLRDKAGKMEYAD